jgi:aspartyl-tRNA synthetase
VAKHLSVDERKVVAERTGAGDGDMVIFAAGPAAGAASLLGAMRVEIARRIQVTPNREWDFLWVNQMPMFEWNADERRADALHHPFTRPLDDDLAMLETEPLNVRAAAYDIVCNGNELGSGSLRIHDSDVQSRVFRALGIDDATAQARFGFFLEALRYGTPPHGGIAPGLDRITALLCGEAGIREVIAFPKTQQAQDLMADTPSPVDPLQLTELGIAVLKAGSTGGQGGPPKP